VFFPLFGIWINVGEITFCFLGAHFFFWYACVCVCVCVCVVLRTKPSVSYKLSTHSVIRLCILPAHIPLSIFLSKYFFTYSII
jgi:hypothetical protein